jgi:hypothetical protein
MVNLGDYVIVNEEASASNPTQATSFGTIRVPRGTVVVLARDCYQEDFEEYWGVTLGPNVEFLVSGDINEGVPVINGSERYRIYGPNGVVADGLTVRGNTGQSYRRIHPGAPGSMASWEVASEDQADPGVTDLSPSDHGIFISEWSDASGGGNWGFEFVEIYVNP